MPLGPQITPAAQAVIDALEAQDAAEREQGLPGAERLQALHPHSARLIYWLALQHMSRLIVEVGTSHGYSTIWLALAAQVAGARVITCERRPGRARLARQNLAAAGLADLVEVREGAAQDWLQAIAGPVDFLFIDAEKSEYGAYLAAARPALASGALVVADNLTSHADELADFMAGVAADPALYSTVLDIDRGLLLGVYRP